MIPGDRFGCWFNHQQPMVSQRGVLTL